METADDTATPSSPRSPATTASRLTGVLASVADLELFRPASDAEAGAAIESVKAYCRDYCPVNQACVEDDCRLFRLEGRALDVLGLPRPGPAENVGVVSAPVTAL